MQNNLEPHITQLIRTLGQSDLVADELLKLWDQPTTSWQQKEQIAEFLIQSGYYSAFLLQMVDDLEKNLKLHWPQVIRCLGIYLEQHAKNKAPDDIKNLFDPIFMAAGERNELAEVVICDHCDKWDTRFQKIRAQIQKEQRELQRRTIKSKLDNVILLLQGKNFIEAENQMDELLRFDQNDDEIKEVYFQFLQTRARELITHKRTLPPTLEEIERRLSHRFSKEELEKQQIVIDNILSRAKQDATIAYDCAINLHLMGCKREAIEALYAAEESEAKDWLLLELLIESQRFVEAFALSETLEQKYANNGEASFAAHYSRARALWGMLQKRAAVEMLEQLVNVRPDYRAANSLLLEWKENLS